MPTLHLCLDEAGNLSFNAKGTKHYIFAVAWTLDPKPLANDLTDLRYSLLKQGHDIHSFHATEDRQANRDEVVARLRARSGWQFAGLVVEKRKLNPSLYNEERFYPFFAGMLLRFVFKGFLGPADRVLAFTDTLPVNKHRAAVAKAFKSSCRADLPLGTPFEIYHHPRQANCWLQVADYCCWSLYRKWENGDFRTYGQLAPRLSKRELDVFSRGDGTIYY
ncbi:MAG: DUF3800 domain-containing protein [Vicinamibacterales bacterium]